MRESIARNAALATGALVVGAVALFAALQQRQDVDPITQPPPPTAEAGEVDGGSARPLATAPSHPPPAPRPSPDPAPRTGTGRTDAQGPGTAPPTEEPPVPAAAAEPEVTATTLAIGQRVYRQQRCATCHSIAGVGSPRSPLDGVGSRLTEEEIRLWIVDPRAMRPRVGKPSYDGLPPEELEALVAFIQSLR